MVVYGAFGSGKTYCLAESVRCMVQRKKDKRILICTFCESASNVFFDMWDSETKAKAIRLVRNETEINETNGYSIVCCVPLTDKVRKQITSASIVVCTFYTSILLNENPGIGGSFTHILIDEAAQALECETIMPLTLAMSNTTVILAGDHRQIGPSVFCRENYIFFGTNLSLLQRLFGYYNTIQPLVKIDMREFKLMLTVIHRTVEQIVKFISFNFYNGIITARRKPVEIAQNSGYYPIQFIDSDNSSGQQVDELYDPAYCSYKNEREAEAIISYAKMLISKWPNGWQNVSLGIVSSELAQVNHILSRISQDSILKKHLVLKQLKVDLVHNFQGTQFTVILVSTVRTRYTFNQNDYLLFNLLFNPYSINTCLTRCEELVVVFGNRSFLTNVPEPQSSVYQMKVFWRNLISLCIMNSSYYYISTFQTSILYFDRLEGMIKNKNITKKTDLEHTNRATTDDNYIFQQKFQDYILDKGIHDDNCLDENNNEHDNVIDNCYDSSDDDLPLSRRKDKSIVKVIPYKRPQQKDEVRERRKRKLFTADDALDSLGEDSDLDEEFDIEELENYMCMDTTKENEATNRGNYKSTSNIQGEKYFLQHATRKRGEGPDKYTKR